MQHILDRQFDGVLEIQFNRPEKKNAVTGPMYQRLHELLEKGAADDAIKVIYIRGHDNCFSAGNDVGDLAKGMQSNSNHAGNFIATMIAMEKPVVAAVSGVAIGIGATLLFHCDLIYADEGATLITPFTKLGVCPEAGASYALAARIGAVRANDMLLRSQPLGARKALEMGLINDVFETSKLHKEVERIAVELAALPSRSVQFTKKLIRREYADKSQQAFDAEIKGFQELLESPDAKMAFEAFLSKK